MLLPTITKLAFSALISAATLTNPTTPKTLSFDASAYVTLDHQIRLSVQKTSEIPVVILLRDADNQIVYRQNLNKKEAKYAAKLNVDQLPDGQYELEVKSSEGSIRKQLTVSTTPARQLSRVVAMQ